MKQKTEDFKLSAVSYYNNNDDGYDKTCNIFGCKKSSLKRWIRQHKTRKHLGRKTRKSISYKIKKDEVKSALNILDKNEQYTMSELSMLLKEKYKNFDISQQHLGRIMRNHNRTRKRTRHEHFPDERRKTPTDKEQELNDFYNTVKKYPMDKIISLDETSVGALLMPSYSRCFIGKRCIVNTNKNFVFKKFTLLVAINNSQRIGYEFYDKGGTTKERMVEFFEKYIFGKYKNHLIILDNARSHQNDLIKEAILKSGNQYLFSIPYTPKTNAIEQYFNQLKYYLKKYRNVNNFQQLRRNVIISLDKIKQENYRNYFQDAYGRKHGLEYSRNPSTRKCNPKKYKD
jgi:transposase-like protein/transposase